MSAPKSFQLIPCQSPLWAPEGHTQTIFGDMLPSPGLTSWGERWALNTPDGDQIICRVFQQDSPWVVTLFHGLTGSIESKYMQRTTRELLAQGFTVVLMNHQNAGEGKGLARQPYHCGKSDDMAFLIKQVRNRFPGRKVLSIGFSLSANALLLLMANVVPHHRIFTADEFNARKDELQMDRPDIAVTVNAPINIEKAAININRSLNRMYEFNFMSAAHWIIKDLERKGVFHPSKGLHPLMKVTFFDEAFTAPRSGFESSRLYYDLCSAKNYFHQIDRPTACLTSANDPFIDYRDYLEVKIPSNVRLHVERSGGHMGYLHKEKTPLGTFRWLDYGVMEISKEMIKAA